jgi:Derlin-2/3
MLAVVGAVLQLLGWWLGWPILSGGLLAAVIYVWSKRNPRAQTSFWGARFDGVYLPWVLVAFTLLVGDDPMVDLMGIAAGHAYYFMKEVLPGEATFMKGTNLLATPRFIYRIFGVPPTDVPAALAGMAARMGGRGGGGVAGGAAPVPPPARPVFGGQGRVLGRGD